MKRMTPAEAAEWRRKSVERYRAKRQKPISRSSKPVTPQRARKQAEDAEYRRNREMRLVRARGWCEMLWPDPDGRGRQPCNFVATQTHHVMRRSHHVDHGVENLRALCATHHAYIHANVEWAKENGWIRTEWDKIGETPMER